MKRLPWKKSDISRFCPWKRKRLPWKILKFDKKVGVKSIFCPWKFWQIPPVKKNSMPVKNLHNFPRENENKMWFLPFFNPWNRFFYPWKKRKKRSKLGVKEKNWAWKKSKKQQKVGVKSQKCPWKNPKNGKKLLSRPLFFSRPKKKTLDSQQENLLFIFFKKF